MSSLHAAGEPDLPVISRSLVVPDDGVMSVRVVSVEVRDHELIVVAPSKGILQRDTDPGKVPYVFGDVYGRDEYNPARRTLRLLHQITIEV